MFSCAGYTVASFVLGLGDRHNDNIMIRKSGHLFHIDFAHFLGNMMKWRGIKRETAPFVLTNEFVHVMGGEKSEMFKSFVALCCSAYNILRRNNRLLVSLFVMMLHAGLPQLQKAEDIEHLKTALAVDMTDAEADIHFRKLIMQSLKSRTTKMNFAIHNLAKMGNPN
jgi:phosphatidylinositol kinase/protein kinase (PI-3  family)